jgi:hypothetical protein
VSVSVRINWDERNSPRAFYLCFGIAEIATSAIWMLAKLHLIRTVYLLEKDNPLPIRFLGLLVLGLTLATLSLYCNLMINGIWHRNPATINVPEDGDAEPDDSPINLLSSPVVKENAEINKPGSLFANASLDDVLGDPIITRDQIQWRQMAMATAAMIVCCTVFVLLFS